MSNNILDIYSIIIIFNNQITRNPIISEVKTNVQSKKQTLLKINIEEYYKQTNQQNKKIYLKTTKKNDNEIAQFYYQEQLKVKEGGMSDFVFSKKQFYNKLISQIQALRNESIYTFTIVHHSIYTHLL